MDAAKCARFVEKVEITIYNRWGVAVFTYTGFAEADLSNEEDGGIFIDWDGRNDDGAELASGVYYYQAEVTFDVVDPSQAKQTLKGWVQLLR